jgi:hypothetical protein
MAADAPQSLAADIRLDLTALHRYITSRGVRTGLKRHDNRVSRIAHILVFSSDEQDRRFLRRQDDDPDAKGTNANGPYTNLRVFDKQ